MKQSNPKITNIMKFLPRPASAVTFQNPPISPGRENRPLIPTRGFSGPIKISIIPREARRSKSDISGFETLEPTSPKVSCIGQIKHKKLIKELAKKSTPAPAVEIPGPKKRHPTSAIKRIFSGVGKSKSNVAAAPSGKVRGGGKPPLPERAPGLNQMKRFSSGRGALTNFDWTAQIAPADDVEAEEAEGGDRRSPVAVWIDEEVGPLQPRKEVNIWKRRTVVPPTPLQLYSTTVKQKL